MAEYICIVCPNSCRLRVEETENEITVRGHECKRGIAHGISEHGAPLRMLTTTVAVTDGSLPRLPVISTAEVPKSKLRGCLDILYRMEVSAPVQCGQLICPDICGTGVDVVAGRSMDVSENIGKVEENNGQRNPGPSIGRFNRT